MILNILYLIDSLGNGGTERQLAELIKGLDRNRFSPHLCTLKPSTALYDELDIPKLSLGFASFTHLSNIAKLFKLNKFIRNNKIHIIQTFFQDPFLLAAMIKPFHRVKLVGSFRDLGFWRTPAESMKMRLAYPFFDGFVANSKAVKDHFVKTDSISARSIKVINNIFDYSALNRIPGRTKKCERTKTVGIVANLNRPVKRVQDFIKAAVIICKKMSNVRFVVIGDGHLRKELEILANELSMQERLVFYGRVSHPLDFVGEFDVGVITSETEGFCNAIIEYMACGVPVVATDTGGNRELIINSNNGYLVPVGDVDAIADRILKLLDCPDLAESMGDAGVRYVKDNFSLARILEKYCDLYDSIIINDN